MVEYTHYTNAKTKFVRDKIKLTHWEDRHYIDVLLDFEKIISRGGPWQWAQALWYHGMVEKYKKEWTAIYKEMKPQQYGKFIEREKQQQMEDKKSKEHRRQIAIQKELLEEEEWRKARGSAVHDLPDGKRGN